MYKIYPKTLFVGQKFEYLPTCQSTNDVAADHIAQSEPDEGLVILTDDQTAGRGQRGNQWEAQAGHNLTFSLILRPSFLNATEQFWLNMAVSLGIADALEPLTGELLRIKWPNDLYLENQKLGGILIENTLQGYLIAWSVIGIGVNINQTQFSFPTATSLLQRFPVEEEYNRPALLTIILESLEQRYLQLRTGQRNLLRASYLQRLFRYQEEHSFIADNEHFRGCIVGIDATGRLAIQTNSQLRYFGFKEVEFVI
ncbi:biotin--[acetyl-CoA-carboxylase] ligase [Nibrella saemangeumensis]|uniref:Biotin--[acetyl-CoA-carboxylase] ligase n=1 Tax=Nibrella saemangeumensis TaxID=1084526 RepID=A0ABP8MWU5_9BACT